MEDMQEEAPADGPRAKGRLQRLEGAINLLCKTFPGRILIVGASQVAATRAYHRDYAGAFQTLEPSLRAWAIGRGLLLERDGIKVLNELPEGLQKPTGRMRPGRKMPGQMAGGYYGRQAADGQASPFYEVYIAVLKEGITPANFKRNTYDEKHKPKAKAAREQAKAQREQAKAQREQAKAKAKAAREQAKAAAKAKPKPKPKPKPKAKPKAPQASRFRGVSKFKRAKAKPWAAQIKVTEDGKQRTITIGRFAREEDAACAFDRVNIAKLGHAEAPTNFPVEQYRAKWAELEALGVEGAVALMREHAAAERPEVMNKASRFRGVSKDKTMKTKPWVAKIGVTEDGKKRQFNIGRFAR